MPCANGRGINGEPNHSFPNMKEVLVILAVVVCHRSRSAPSTLKTHPPRVDRLSKKQEPSQTHPITKGNIYAKPAIYSSYVLFPASYGRTG